MANPAESAYARSSPEQSPTAELHSNLHPRGRGERSRSRSCCLRIPHRRNRRSSRRSWTSRRLCNKARKHIRKHDPRHASISPDRHRLQPLFLCTTLPSLRLRSGPGPHPDVILLRPSRQYHSCVNGHTPTLQSLALEVSKLAQVILAFCFLFVLVRTAHCAIVTSEGVDAQ